MGLFDRFKKEKGETITVNESDDYYTDNRTDRRTAALLLGLATFVATLIIGSALFFGGRAIYRAVFSDGENDTNTTQVQQGGEERQEPQSGAQGDEEQSDQQPNQGDDSAGSQDGRQAPQTGDIPATGDVTLPATGDEGM